MKRRTFFEMGGFIESRGPSALSINIMTIIRNIVTPLSIPLLQGMVCIVCLSNLSAQESGLADLPQPVVAKDFIELMNNSPFTRSLDLSNSLILTGVAKVEGKPVATLMNRETKETYVISESPNAQGWKMVGISDGRDLERVTAKIALSGGEVVTVRFDESQLKPGEAKPAAGPGGDRKSESRDGKRRRFSGGPPPEVMEKLRAMSDEQRAKLREYIGKQFKKNPNMSSDERRAMMGKAMERVTAEGKKK